MFFFYFCCRKSKFSTNETTNKDATKIAVFAVWDNETAFLSVMFNVDSVEVSISTLLYNLTPNNYQVNRIF
jgi:hypothetical protein